jgi:hypothetical protein
MRLLDDPEFKRVYMRWAKRKSRALRKPFFRRNMNDLLVLEKGVRECAIQEYLMEEEKEQENKQMIQTRFKSKDIPKRNWDKIEYLVEENGDFVVVSKPKHRKDELWNF